MFFQLGVAQKDVSFTLAWQEVINPELGQTIIIDELDRPYFYFASKNGGLNIYDNTDASSPKWLLKIPVDSLEGHHVMNLFQDSTTLYLAMGDFFADSAKAALATIDITSPESPIVMDIWASSRPLHGSTSVVVEQDLAYLGGMQYGIFIIDVRDKYDIDSIGAFVPNLNWPVENPGAIQEPNVREMEIRDSLMFVCFDAGGLRVLNITDPAKPFQIAQYINPLNDSVQQAYNDIHINGNLAYISLDFCGFEIVDISSIEDIHQVGFWNPWDCTDGTWLFNEGHGNQLAFIEEEKIVLMSSGDSEILALDVSEPMAPKLAGSYGIPGNGQGAWGVTYHEGKVYGSYIATLVPFISFWSGIKVLDLSIDTTITATSFIKKNEPIFKLYPNPFVETIAISLEANQSAIQSFEVMSAEGRVIYQENVSIFDSMEELSWEGQSSNGVEVSPGVYFIKVYTDQGIQVLKCIKTALP